MPHTPLPLPPSNQMLAIDLLVEMSNMSGLDLYPRWLPGNQTSSIRHPSFLLSTISLPVFSSSFCLIFRLCRRNLHISAFCKGSGANVLEGQGQDLAKEENLDVAGGEMFQGREKEAS